MRSFNRDLMDHIKVVLSTRHLSFAPRHHWRYAREAKETVDKLYKSAGDMVLLFGSKGYNIEDVVVSFGKG